jgi:hypothetical protein
MHVLNWRDIAWNLFGFITLLFFTATFSLAALRGRQMAAVNCLVICSVLLYLLPPHARRRR